MHWEEQQLYDTCEKAASLKVSDAGSLAYVKAVDETPHINDIPQIEMLDDKALAAIATKIIEVYEPIEDTYLILYSDFRLQTSDTFPICSL